MVRGRKNPLHFGLAARLKKARRQSELTRLPISKKAGISDTTIADIENGQRVPTVGSVARIASALGLSAGWLAFGIGEQRSNGRAVSSEGMGERLRVVRTACGHTKAALARKADLSPGAVLGVERGGQAGIDTIERLAKELRISPAWLAFGIGPQVLPSRRGSRAAHPVADC